jgi:hypothetical protein
MKCMWASLDLEGAQDIEMPMLQIYGLNSSFLPRNSVCLVSIGLTHP